MLPKKSKDFYAATALELGISEDLVKDAVEMYWSEVRKALTEMKHITITVTNIGRFIPKEKKLRETLAKYERIFKANDGNTFRKMAIKNEVSLRIQKIEKVLSMIEQNKIKKQLVKVKRDEYVKQDLEEQTANTPRPIQQDLQDGSSRENLQKEDENM